MSRSRSWRWDWAGPHGTAWGTANGMASTVTAAVVVHVWAHATHTPRWLAALVPLGIWLLAGVWTLGRAAVAVRPIPAGTTCYRLACWTGACWWAAWTVARQSWTVGGMTRAIMMLVAAAAVAGIVAGIASAGPASTPPEVPATLPVDASQRARDAAGTAWEQRLRRVAGVEARVVAIETWPRGNGHTVEAHLGAGGKSWRAVDACADALAADLDLPHGCRVSVQMGTSRRHALIAVMTRDELGVDRPYPMPRPVHSINDDLEVAFDDEGRPVGPNLRQNCAVIGGETGSGKSNAGHAFTAEIVTCDDALEWRWDPTGKSWLAWMDPWLTGAVGAPALDWCAQDPTEIWWMARAARRVATVRPTAYRQMMLDADDDKIPVGPGLPEIVVTGDEVAPITGAVCAHPHIREELRLIVFEGRAGGVRAIFYPLRGTDDVFLSTIQSQCHVRGVMRVQSSAEAGWLLMSGASFGPEDTPYPGCGGLRLSSGAPVIKVKYPRMAPTTIRMVVELAQSRRPELDEVSRRAANGRRPDGTPMDGLEPGELDCYDTRWDRFLAAAGHPARSATVPPGHVIAAGSQEREVAKLQQTFADLDAAVARAKAGHAEAELSRDDDETFRQMMAAAGFGPDWTDLEEAPEETPEETGHLEALWEIVRDAGAGGIAPRDILPRLRERGIRISRDTLHKRLNALLAAGRVVKPSHGRWYAA